jgi:hypothetical protein
MMGKPATDFAEHGAWRAAEIQFAADLEKMLPIPELRLVSNAVRSYEVTRGKLFAPPPAFPVASLPAGTPSSLLPSDPNSAASPS